MQNFIIGILVVVSTSMVNGQSESKSKAIDALLIETKAKESTQQIMFGLIKQSISKKPNAPKSLDHEIQNSLDYEGYIIKVKAAYDKAYTKEEINELTQLHKSGEINKYKEKSERVTKALYDIGVEFGRESVVIIQKKIQSY